MLNLLRPYSAPPLTDVPAPTRNSSGSVEPPLPPKGTHKTRWNNGSGSTSQDYEVPRSIVVQASGSVHHPRHHPLTRLSLSPQLGKLSLYPLHFYWGCCSGSKSCFICFSTRRYSFSSDSQCVWL